MRRTWIITFGLLGSIGALTGAGILTIGLLYEILGECSGAGMFSSAG